MKKVMILIAEGHEECEALVTYDLLKRAAIDVELISIKDEYVTSSHKLHYKTHKLLSDINYQEYDAVVLPGGIPGTYNLEEDERVINIIKDFKAQNKLICAICAAPSILIHLGYLKDNKFTCYPSFEENLQRANVRAIQDENIITSCGLGGVFEFSYLIIKNLLGEDKAHEVLKEIIYE